jgi:hypothetical protein
MVRLEAAEQVRGRVGVGQLHGGHGLTVTHRPVEPKPVADADQDGGHRGAEIPDDRVHEMLDLGIVELFRTGHGPWPPEDGQEDGSDYWWVATPEPASMATPATMTSMPSTAVRFSRSW